MPIAVSPSAEKFYFMCERYGYFLSQLWPVQYNYCQHRLGIAFGATSEYQSWTVPKTEKG